MVAEADTVAAFVSYRSSHTCLFMGHAPMGKPVRVTGMDIMRYRDGQVIELWSQIDDSRPVAATGALHQACGTAAYRMNCGAHVPFSQRVPAITAPFPQHMNG